MEVFAIVGVLGSLMLVAIVAIAVKVSRDYDESEEEFEIELRKVEEESRASRAASSTRTELTEKKTGSIEWTVLLPEHVDTMLEFYAPSSNRKAFGLHLPI